MRIERDTKTDIKIPRQGHDGDVVILGPTAQVLSLGAYISMLVFSKHIFSCIHHICSLLLTSTIIWSQHHRESLAGKKCLK